MNESTFFSRFYSVYDVSGGSPDEDKGANAGNNSLGDGGGGII